MEDIARLVPRVRTRADIDYRTLAKLTDIANGYLLEPGELVLGITKERITLPELFFRPREYN